MAQIPNLDNAPLNLSSLRDQSRKEIFAILNNIGGNKCLVVDPKLDGSLSLIVQTSDLMKDGTEVRHLNADPVQTDCSKVVYLVRSQLDLMKLICSHIHNDSLKSLQRKYYIYFVPRRAVACEKILEDEKVHHKMTIGEFPLYVIPCDKDVLSFELDLAYKECLVDGDTSSLWHIAKAIHKLEFSFGLIPNVRAKGNLSVRVAKILEQMHVEEPVNTSDMAVPEITLILIDREVDMVTPMCTQLTYEGLLDELLRINNGAVEINSSIMPLGPKDGTKQKVPLNSSDKVFKEIRDLSFVVAYQVLRQKATSMKQDYTDRRHMTTSELGNVVRNVLEIERHMSLAQHLSTFRSKPSFCARLEMEHLILEAESSDKCFDYIEEMIYKQEPLLIVLRLLILFSVTNSGLPKRNFDYLRRKLLHTYGFQHMATLSNLEKAGLFKKQESKSNWPMIKKYLQLLDEDTNTAKPIDFSYVPSGYAPLSVYLIDKAIRCGWRPIKKLLELLPGPDSETKGSGFASSTSFDSLPGAAYSTNKVDDGRRSLALVVFIGGVTYAEISALRFLSSQEGMPYELIVASTNIVNGHTLVDTLVQKLG